MRVQIFESANSAFSCKRNLIGCAGGIGRMRVGGWVPHATDPSDIRWDCDSDIAFRVLSSYAYSVRATC